MTFILAGAALVAALLAAIALVGLTAGAPPSAATWRILSAGPLSAVYPLLLKQDDSRADAPCGAAEQPHTEPVFQCAHGLAGHRLTVCNCRTAVRLPVSTTRALVVLQTLERDAGSLGRQRFQAAIWDKLATKALCACMS